MCHHAWTNNCHTGWYEKTVKIKMVMQMVYNVRKIGILFTYHHKSITPKYLIVYKKSVDIEIIFNLVYYISDSDWMNNETLNSFAIWEIYTIQKN